MLRKPSLSRPLLVLIALLMAALACYSDDPDPLGIFEFTPAPPTNTPLPPPDPSNPAKYSFSDLLLCPIPVGGGTSQCFVTNNPEEVARGQTNTNISCEYDDELEVLYMGRLDATTVYYLVACSGTVGWINENRLMGPVRFPLGESGLTTVEGAQDGVFPISVDRPPRPSAKVNCQVNEVVEVVGISGDAETGIIYNQIRCSGGSGWVEQDRLFGPLPLVGTGGLGIIRPDFETVTLTNEPTSPTTDNTIGECNSNTVITTNNIQRVGDKAFYNINCGDLQGWAEDQYLVEILYRPDSLVYIEVTPPPEQAPTAETADTADVSEDTGDTAEDTAIQEVVLTAPMTENPEFATDSNVIGECPTATIVLLKQTTLVTGEFFYQIECADTTGWVQSQYVLTGVKFFLGTEVQISEQGFVGDGSEAGFYINDTPSVLRSQTGSIGACTVNTPAVINGIDMDPSPTGSGITVYYQLTCQNADETSDTPEITGWVAQERLFTNEELQSDSATNGLIGG